MSSHGPDPISGRKLAPGPLFVVSMWRSGSSLLYALLNKHPQVALMYEADLLLLRSVFLKPRPLRDWARRWEFWNEAFRRHGLSTTDVASAADFPTAFAAVHQLYAQRRGATIWGDKSPNYYDRLNEMADNFPHARFVIVWRDPYGTANSILLAASLGNSYFSRKGAVLCGVRGYEIFKRECDRLLARGKPVCQLNYEDLITDTPAVMQSVCQFLQIPYDDSLSILAGADRSAVLNGQHHANLKSDQIVRGPRPQRIDSTLRRKISQYLASWHQLYGAGWPPRPQTTDSRPKPLGKISQFIDGALYRFWRTRDRISPIVFSFVPISLLQRYRDMKQRRREEAAAHREPADTEGSPCRGALAKQAANIEVRP